MAASVFDSPLHAQLFPTGETGRLFSDSAAIRSMLLVEGALAKAQGEFGIIPEISAAAIHRASLEIQIDPGALAKATGSNGVSIPGLIAAFRAEMNAPEHAQFVHWGATSQDVVDTGLMLRLRQCLKLAEADLRVLITALADHAEKHADLAMPARTYGQHATPTSWGAVLASWGTQLLDLLDGLEAVRANSLYVSLSGASGTSAALGDKAPDIRRVLAQGLDLGDPGRSWHTDRGPIMRIADWMARITGIMGSMGHTLIGLTTSGIGEAQLGGAGASSTMPQKQNPVQPSVLGALSNQMAGLRASLHVSGQHQHQRDGAAWFTEWMVLPQLVLNQATALQVAIPLVQGLNPGEARMSETLMGGLGLLQAEALSFALAELMPRPEAQAVTKQLCKDAIAQNRDLSELALAAYPALPASLFDPKTQMGQAPQEARAFVARARAM